MKLKAFEKNIQMFDEEVEKAQEKLTGLEPGTEEYDKVCESIKKLQENKQIEVENKVKTKNGLVPMWATTLAGFGVSLLFGGKVLKEERAGGVISSQAVNVWDKISRKFN
jgi:hypothetical protein